MTEVTRITRAGERRLAELQAASGREARADLEASSRLCLAALPALSAEAEALASQAHCLLLDAQLAEREPYVTVRLSARDARQAALALTAEQADLEPLAGPGTERAARALQAAGWQPGVHPAPRAVSAEELAEREAAELAVYLQRDRTRAGVRAASPPVELAAEERDALAWLTGADDELPDDYVMTVTEVVRHAVDALAGRLEELYGNKAEEQPEPARPAVGWEGWRRVACAALSDDLEAALGSLPVSPPEELR